MYMQLFATTILFFAVVAIQEAASQATLEPIECSGPLLDVPGLEADCLAVATALSEAAAQNHPEWAPYYPPNGFFECTPIENGLTYNGQWVSSVPTELLPQDFLIKRRLFLEGCFFWVDIINSMIPASVVPVTCGGAASSDGFSIPCGISGSTCDRLKVDDSSSAQECAATASAIDTIVASSSKGKKGKKGKSSKSSKSKKSKKSKKGKAAALEAKQAQAVRLEVGAGVALVGMVGFVALVATKLRASVVPGADAAHLLAATATAPLATAAEASPGIV